MALMPFKLQYEIKLRFFSLSGNVMSVYSARFTAKTHQIGSVFDHSGADVALETDEQRAGVYISQTLWQV